MPREPAYDSSDPLEGGTTENRKDKFGRIEAADKNLELKFWGRETQASRGTRKTPLIAISDDNTNLLFLLSSELEAEGYDVITVPDKRALLNKLNLIKPDAVITDISSPGMNGFEFIKKAKENLLTKHIPIIVATGTVDVYDRIETLRLGASDLISKPYELDIILESLRRVLKKIPLSPSEKPENT